MHKQSIHKRIFTIKSINTVENSKSHETLDMSGLYSFMNNHNFTITLKTADTLYDIVKVRKRTIQPVYIMKFSRTSPGTANLKPLNTSRNAE